MSTPAPTFSESYPPGSAPPEVERWVRAAPLGTAGTASELLPLFLASGVPALTAYGVPWSRGSFGVALCKLRGRIVGGRVLTRRLNRAGTALYSIDAAAPPPALPVA
jgi:hypothetical protein